MRTRLLIAVLALAPAWSLSMSAPEPAITARCGLLFDANSGKVLFKKNENERMPVASTQKLLTALLVVEAGNLDKKIIITQSDTQCEPTKLYLKPGESYTRRDLLTVLMVKSANDVARALARDNAGSVAAFAEKMNERMRKLGGNASNFKNPNGLPAENQYSTARDMARVARAAYFNPTIREMIRTKYFTFKYNSGRTITLKNTNRVLRTFSFCNGMKTGYTVRSGHCLISSGTYAGKDMIAIVLGSNKARVWPESTSLLAYGLEISDRQLESLRIDSSSSSGDQD
jgi:D-alanyl-D-alanine carboxypeptidase (penicillin-binding protein 5/6)